MGNQGKRGFTHKEEGRAHTDGKGEHTQGERKCEGAHPHGVVAHTRRGKGKGAHTERERKSEQTHT